jgi:hypothetical protein
MDRYPGRRIRKQREQEAYLTIDGLVPAISRVDSLRLLEAHIQN